MSYRRPETLSFMPWVRWPPWGSARPMIVSPGVQQRVVDGRVGLRAGVRLDVGVLGAEELLGAVDRELLGDVDVLAAAVVALAGIALGVLVGQHAALALEDGLGHEVLGGDHLQRPLLALELEPQDVGDLGIDLGQRAVEEVGAQVGHGRLLSAADRRTGAQALGVRASSLPGGRFHPRRQSRRPKVAPRGAVSLQLPSKLGHPVVDRAHRLVAELLARPRDVDRGLQRGEPVGQARERRPAGQRQHAPGRPRRRPPGAAATGRGMLRFGGVDALGGEQARDELAEDDRLAVGDEVDAARACRASRARTRPSTTLSTWVVEVRWPPAADPREAPGADGRDERGQDRRVARAPDEPRPHDDRLEAAPFGLEHGLLGARLRRGVQRGRVEPQRRALVDSTSGSPASSAASVPTWTKRRTPARRQASSALRVPCTLPRSKSARRPHSPRCAAPWKANSQPPRARRASRADVVEVAA